MSLNRITEKSHWRSKEKKTLKIFSTYNKQKRSGGGGEEDIFRMQATNNIIFIFSCKIYSHIISSGYSVFNHREPLISWNSFLCKSLHSEIHSEWRERVRENEKERERERNRCYSCMFTLEACVVTVKCWWVNVGFLNLWERNSGIWAAVSIHESMREK